MATWANKNKSESNPTWANESISETSPTWTKKGKSYVSAKFGIAKFGKSVFGILKTPWEKLTKH